MADADVVVLSHAQIGGLDEAAFTANNVIATERVIAAVRAKSPYVVHLSLVGGQVGRGRLVHAEQEGAGEAGGRMRPAAVVLRPTLMFGWFDRKHLGWLARFMKKVPVFPMPGSGRYLRQPLYAGDFCDIIMACIEQRPVGQTFNISGQEKIDYIDLIRAVKEACGARAPIVRIPYRCSGRCSGSMACSIAIRPSPPSSSRHW